MLSGHQPQPCRQLPAGIEILRVAHTGHLEPTPARHGYRLKEMTEQFGTKAAEIRAMFSNQLEPKRTAEIRERMLAAGLPI
ncbi:phosphoribulokinase [Roseateles sp. GG27B]